MRLAVGATRWQLICHLLTESVLLSVTGGVVGCVLAWWIIRSLSTLDEITEMRCFARGTRIALRGPPRCFRHGDHRRISRMKRASMDRLSTRSNTRLIARAFLGVTMATFALGCGAEASDADDAPIAKTESPIISGTPVQTNTTGVVAIYHGFVRPCSGTLIRRVPSPLPQLGCVCRRTGRERRLQRGRS